jgi:hypothetical protein
LIILLVHSVEGRLQVLDLFVVHPFHIGDLSRLVGLKSLYLMHKLRIFLLQLSNTVNVAWN